MMKQWIPFWTNPSWHGDAFALMMVSTQPPEVLLARAMGIHGARTFSPANSPGSEAQLSVHTTLKPAPLPRIKRSKSLLNGRLHCEDYLRYVHSTFCLLWSQYRKLDFSSTWGVVLQVFPHVLARGGSPAAVWHPKRVTPLGVTHKRWKRHLLLWGSVKRFDTTMIMAPYGSMSCKFILKFHAFTAVVLSGPKKGPIVIQRSTWRSARCTQYVSLMCSLSPSKASSEYEQTPEDQCCKNRSWCSSWSLHGLHVHAIVFVSSVCVRVCVHGMY